MEFASVWLVRSNLAKSQFQLKQEVSVDTAQKIVSVTAFDQQANRLPEKVSNIFRKINSWLWLALFLWCWLLKQDVLILNNAR